MSILANALPCARMIMNRSSPTRSHPVSASSPARSCSPLQVGGGVIGSDYRAIMGQAAHGAGLVGRRIMSCLGLPFGPSTGGHIEHRHSWTLRSGILTWRCRTRPGWSGAFSKAEEWEAHDREAGSARKMHVWCGRILCDHHEASCRCVPLRYVPSLVGRAIHGAGMRNRQLRG